ncbi:sarcolemmal membrane-associated protein-like isoform X3 [Daphnia carinata]|uniref:sarcolemmal membrane-associated protein-like isoform X3 n=1 Tax=Daphnia carinata TaxID=120202 RepID=UPI002868EE0D|nr:sarcolemmal membrane-associated protein-like isoform X3 [Daphnia carinata]
MVVIEFDLPRSVSLSALDENNVTLKDTPENGGQESNKMVPRATLICRPNSHPFQERNLSLESAMKVGRSVARVKPAVNNAIFDCKVLSRNHALLWYKDGKFYLQDTKSSNGTFVNNQRLSKGSEESAPREVCSGDIVQFGVDVMENSRKVTHGCIVATVKLYLPDGKEAKASPSTGIQEEEDNCELGKQDLYQLNQWIQEAVIREQVLETKLGSLQRIVSATREAAEMGWTALMEEDRLLTRIESLENQLIVSSKNFHEDKLREEIRKLYDEKNIYQDVSKESLRKVLTEKMETLKKLQETERSLSNAEDERDNMKELNDKLNEQILELAEKFEKESEELQACKRKLQEADNQQIRLEQEMQSRQDALREAQEKETILLAQVESRQAEIDFTKEQLANLRLRLDSMKVTEELKKDENEIGGDEVEDKSNNVKENQTETLRHRVAQLESQLKTSYAKNLNGEFVPDPIGYKSKEVDRLQGPCTWDCYLYRNQLACCSLILQELLEETRAKCRVLESEVERRQLEAQDGWSAAAHLQQYFRNLHNILKGSSEQDEEFTDEPSALAELVRTSIVSLNNEYQELREANAKNKDLISLLTLRLSNYEKEEKRAQHTANQKGLTSEMEYLRDEVAILTIQLKEMEVSRIEQIEERQKWQRAYQSLALSVENRDSGVASGFSSPVNNPPSSRDPEMRDSGIRELNSADDLVTDESITTQQLSEVQRELETLKRHYENVQSEKKELEEEFSQLKDNYSLLSSQSKTVGRWMYVVPLAVLVLAVLIAFRPSD